MDAAHDQTIQRSHDPTVKRSNGQTVLRGRRFAAPWARAAAVAAVAGGMWLGLLGGGVESAWGTTYLIDEAFDSGVPSGWSANNIVAGTDANASNGKTLKFDNKTDYIVTPLVVHPDQLTVNIRRSNNGNAWCLKVSVSTTSQSAGFVEVGSTANAGTSWGEKSVDLSDYSDQSVYIKLEDGRSDASEKKERYLDWVKVSEASSTTPTISVSPASVSGLSTTAGTAGGEGSVTVTGTALTAVIGVSATGAIEFSVDGGVNWWPSGTSGKNLSVAGGTLKVRLSGASAGSASGSVTLSSSGADSVSVPVSGTVGLEEPVVITPISTTQNSGTLKWNNVPEAVTYLVSVWTIGGPGSVGIAADLTGSAVTSFVDSDAGKTAATVSWAKGSNTSYSPNWDNAHLRFYKGNTCTLTAQTGYTITGVTFTGGISGNMYDMTYSVDGGAGTSASWSSGTLSISGIEAGTLTITSSGGQNRMTGMTVTFATSGGGKNYVVGYGAGEDAAEVSQGAGGETGKTKVTVGGLDAETTYHYSVTAVAGETESDEVEGTFTTTAAAAVPEIEVEMDVKAFGNVTVGDTASQTVYISNYGGADLTVSSITFTGTGAGYFSSSLSSSLVVEGDDLDSVTVTFAPTSAGTFNNVTMHVFSDDPENGEVTVTGLSGTGVAIDDPTVTDSPTVGTTSIGWGTTRNGYDVMVVRYASVDTPVAPTQNHEYSVNDTIGTGAGAGTVVYKGNGNSTTVSGLTYGTAYKFVFYSVNNNYYSPGVTKTVTTATPSLSVDPTSVSNMAGVQYQDGTPVNVTVSGENLMGNVTVTVASGQFEVSTDNGLTWGTEKSITASGTLGDTTVKVRIASGSGTGEVTGTLTVSSSNASDVTVSLSGNVSGATTDRGYWLGNSQLVLNGTWYSGSGSGNPALPGSLGYLTTLTLGAQVQTAGQQNGMLYPAYMTYAIDGGTPVTVALLWFNYADNNNWFGVGGTGQYAHDPTTLDLSGLSGGEHTLTVYFSQPTSVGSGTLYENYNETPVNYSITFVIPAWNGPNAVYWREQAVDGHFERQDGDGNHDPWWYQITSTVGFHNPNMTDYGPNAVIFENNNQKTMTIDSACTVASLGFKSGASQARTIGGATLTVNSAITNQGGSMTINAPVALGGNVRAYITSGKTLTLGGGVSGSGKTLTKESAGTLDLASAATLGGLSVDAGTVRLKTGGSLSGNVTVASGATFGTIPSASADSVDYSGVIAGEGAFTKQGDGATTLSGANTFSGGADVQVGTLIANNATALGSGAVTVSGSTAKLQIGAASVSAASVTFSGANSALVTGTGKVLASTGNAVINKVTFDAANYSGDGTQWAIVTSSSGTITLNGTLTVVNAPATGRCELELSADSKTLYVTYHKPPTAPTLTVATVSGNGGALSVTATPPSGADVVVVRYATASYGTPSGTTLPSVGDDPWAGGKVVSVTGGTVTDSGLTGCTRYYYKAWSLKNGLWSTDGTTGDAVTDTVGTPTGLTATDLQNNSFTLEWDDVAGATGYLLSVWTGEKVNNTLNLNWTGGSEAVATTLSIVDTASTPNVTLGSMSFSNGSYSDGAPKWTSAGLYLYYCGTGSNVGDGNYFLLTLASGVKLTGFSVTTAAGGKLAYSVDSGSPTTWTFSGEETKNQTGLAATSSLKIQNTATSRSDGSAATIKAISFSYEVDGKQYVTEWPEAGAAATSPVTVSGLSSGTRYDYQVWAYGATTACKSSTPAEGYTTTEGTATPGAPTVSATVAGAGAMTIRVTAGNPVGTDYLVYRFATAGDAADSSNPTEAAENDGVLVSGAAVSAGVDVTDSGLHGCTTYYYVAWARNGTGGSAVLSSASAVASGTTGTVGTPTGLNETSVGAREATLGWTAPAGGGVEGYAMRVWHYEGAHESQTVTYQSTNTGVAVIGGTAPAGAGVSRVLDGNKYYNCLKSGDSMEITLTGYAGYRITGITLKVGSDDSSGAGSFRLETSGGRVLADIPDSKFNTGNWYGAWEGDYWVTVTPTVGPTDVLTGEDLIIRLGASEDSLWFADATITYEASPVLDVVDSVGQGGVGCTVAGTTATLTGLMPGQTYGWSVAAVAGCTGAAATDADGFTTAVLVQQPTIAEPLTVAAGSLGGTVTSSDATGATLVLKRYASEDAALAGTATGADGVDISSSVTGASGNWSFTDTGLTGCVTYWYRAWARKTVSGNLETSKGSNVASGSPTVGAMGTPTATATANTITVNWSATDGAAGYKVQVATDNQFTTAGGNLVEEDFSIGEIPSGWSDNSVTYQASATYMTSGGEVQFNGAGDWVQTGLLSTPGTLTYLWGASGNTAAWTLVTEVSSNGTSWTQVNSYAAATSSSAKKSQAGPTIDLSDYSDIYVRFRDARASGAHLRAISAITITSRGGASIVAESATLGANATSWMTPETLEAGEMYYYRVQALGGGSCSAWSSPGSIETTGTPTAPVFSPASGEENATVGSELEVTLPAATGYPKTMTYTLAGLSSGLSQTEWSFTPGTREFTFTPTAVGNYVFTLTAANGVTPNGTYALTVHVGAGVPVIGAVSAVPSSTSASVSATGVNMKGAASTAITLEYKATTGTGVVPSAPLTAATGVEPSSLAAGTTSGSLGATLEGLTTGQWYYYKWTVTSAGGTATAEGWFETGCIDAPTVTAWHSGHNLQLSWPPVTGAESYKVEVSTDSTFAGAAGETTTVVSTPNDSLASGWSYVNKGRCAGDYHIMTNALAGVESEAFSTEDYSRMDVNYSLATYGGTGKNKLTCYYAISTDGGTTWGAWVEIDYDSKTATGTSYNDGSMELPPAALEKAKVKVKWEASTASKGVGLRFRGLSVTGTPIGSTAGTTADPAETTLENGKLVWRWTAEEDEEYYYRVTARGGSCDPMSSAVGGPVDLSEASVLSIGTPTRTTIPWTLTPQEIWAGWVLVWNEDGEFGTPPDGVAPGAVGETFAGGTILQKGTGGSSTEVTGTHTGLYACDYHFYKVFAYAEGGVWDTTLHTEMGRTLDPLPPTGVTATGVGTRQFTVNWTPQANDGAARYELTVTKGTTISSETTTVVDNSFASGVPEGWTKNGYANAESGATRLASGEGKDDGSVTSNPLNLTGNEGKAKLTVRAKQYSQDVSDLKVEVQAGSGSWTTAENLRLSADATDYPVTLTGCNAATKIRLSAKAGHRVYLYSVKVEVEKTSSAETTVLAPTDVTGGVTAGQGSWTVTGLDEYTEYNFGVRAVGTECDGDWVTGTVTTLGGPMIGTRPMRLGFGRTTPGAPVTVTLVVTNSGHGPLTVTGATFGGTLLGTMVLQENGAAVSWPMVLAAETGRTLTVKWIPQTGGTLEGTLTLANDTEGLESLVVPLSGTCRDPMSEPPQLTGYEVRGPADRENTVWDDHLKKSPAAGHEVTVKVWLYHASGIVTDGSDAPSFKIYTADGLTLKASGRFTSIREVQRNKREEMECTATVSGWTGDAAPGEYRVRVTANSVNGHSIADAETAMPVEGYYELDRFDRRDEEGHAGHGWTIKTASDSDAVVALKDGRLVINGSASGQPGANGRGGVVRDMQGGGYATEWDADQSQLTWAFNFASGRQTAWSTFDGGNYAGAFVLGATSANLFGEGTTCAGYAVVMRSGKVQLARMSAGLSVDSSLTVLGDGYPVADGRQAIGVKVVFVPGSEHEGEGGTTETVPARLMLYVKEWEGRGAEAITGDSVTGHSVAFETVELSSEADVALLAESLRYVGMAWNHGSSAGGATTYGAFDDVYVPHEEGQGVPMEFDVADEDVEGPVFSDFNARGAFTYSQIPDGGLSVTGLVSDASGVYGANNRWTLYSNDTQVATGTFTANPTGNGAATNVGLSASIATSYFTDTGTFTNYVLEVESTDYDTDWEGDELSATARYHFTVTDQELTEPTSVTADADGAEMVVLRWNAGGTGNWVVIMEGASAIPEDWTPPQGTNLEAGQVLDGPGEAKFRVVYVGNGTWVNMGEGDDANYVCSEATELTVAPGSTNYYRVYGTASGYYGKGIAPTNYPVKTPKYEKGEIVDSFSYPDKVVASSVTEDQWKWASDFSLDREATGAGWDGGWWFGEGQAEDENGRAWKIHDGGLLGGTTEFPAGTANKLFWNDQWADGSEGSKPEENMWMKRKLATPMSGGKVFVAFQMNYQNRGAGKYILVTLTGGSDYDQEIVGFGMTGDNWDGDSSGNRYASMTIPSSVTGDGNTWNTRGSSYGLAPGRGEDYVIVGELDLSEKKTRLWAFYKTQAIPQEYDTALGSKIAEFECAGLAGKTVTGVKIGMGSPAGSWMGQAYVDELRMGTTWDETLLFNKPEVYQYAYGVTNGVDDQGHTLYKISDGQLAGHNPLDMNFNLYHRSGIQSADVRVLDPFASGETTLAGWQNLHVGSGSHWITTWTPSGVNREHINLASNYTVQVKMQATGGKTNMVTSATEGGGTQATDLFFGEYGENAGFDNYLEIYNGTGQDIDLRNYWIGKVGNPEKPIDWEAYKDWTPSGKTSKQDVRPISGGTILNPERAGDWTLHSPETVCIVSDQENTEMVNALLANGCFVIRLQQAVMAVSGDDPQFLLKGASQAELPEGWLDVTGLSPEEFLGATGGDEEYIMYRLESSEVLPRPYPLVMEPTEWDFRPWPASDRKVNGGTYENMLTTAGVYDSNIGLGGNMEFTVYDDDTEPPTIGSGSKIHLGSEELAAQPGTTETVLAGWTFYEDGDSSKLTTNAWGRSMLTNAAITVGPRYAAWLANQTDKSFLRLSGGTDVNKDFAGLTSLANAGRLVVQPNPDWLTAGTDHTWVRFRFGLVKAEDRMFSFADHTASTNSFSSATLEWSTTGRDADDEWTAIASWNPQEEVNTWTLRSFDLSEAASGIPADVATLYLRVNLSGYSGRGSMWSMDNVQLTGYPAELRVSDKELHENGFAFDANVYDESGVDLSGMEVTIGTAKKTPGNAWQTGDGMEETSLARATFEAVSDKAQVTSWYTNSLAGLLHVGLTAKDLDNDRTVGGANVDQETAEGHFGILQVYDDDEDKPAVEMTGMRAVGGTNMVQWKFVQQGSLMPTAWDDALTVSRLGAKTDGASEKNLRWLDASGAAGAPSGALGVRQSGWQHGTKYWYFTVTPEENTQITSLQMFNHVNSQYGPTHFTVTVLQGGSEVFGPTAATYFLGSSTATWEANLDKLNTWIHKSLPVDWTLEKGKTYEFRIQGLGGNKRQGVGAYWGVYDLQLGGGNAETEGMTIKTDADLAAGGSDWLHGSVYDTYSGLDASAEKAPKFTLTGPDGNTLAADQPLTFATELTANGQKKSAEEGRFTGVVPGMGYTDRKLGMYGGWVSAWDADADRTEDSLQSHVGLALTVVDNDVKGPSAPSGVTVNGVAVPETAPARDNVTWTNKPEFVVGFNVAHDQVPTEEELADAAWKTAHGVKDAEQQNIATGVGEYRVALATDAASLSNAPAFSVAVTNGALANYGFERYAGDIGWLIGDVNDSVDSSGINKGRNIDGAYPAAPEGTNSCHLRARGTYPAAAASQVMPFAVSENAQTLTVDLALQIYKRAASSIVYAKFEFSADEETWTAAGGEVGLNTGDDAPNTWLAKTMARQTLTAAAGMKYLRFTLSADSAAAQVDDVRLSVRVGSAPAAGAADRATMRYVPDKYGQGLAVKHLFAVDADNDRAGDRLTGPAAAFYTAYDITPPTPVGIDHGEGATTHDLDDPTTQMKLTWSTSGVGPDDNRPGEAAGAFLNPNYAAIPADIRSAATDKTDVLSPWETYKVYYSPYDANATTNLDTEAKITNYVFETFLAPDAQGDSLGRGRYTSWPNTTATTAAEDTTAPDNPYAAMADRATTGVTLYDLENDQEYMFVVVGVDKAGNEGPATTTSWVTNNTIKFELKKGWRIAKDDTTVPAAWRSGMTNDAERTVSALAWTASGGEYDTNMEFSGEVKKEYDLLFWDSRTFQERPENPWAQIGDSVKTNWFVAEGGPARRGDIRFFRASYKDRWQRFRTVDGVLTTNAQTPLVSAEVYAQTAVRLRSGPESTNTYANSEEGTHNFVALHGVPYTNTLRGVFGGTETFPGGKSSSLATCIDFYDPATGQANQGNLRFWLGTDGHWHTDEDTAGAIDSSDVLLDTNLFTRAFSIDLPYPIPAEYVAGIETNWHGKTPVSVPYMLWKPIVQVPTNTFRHVIECGTQDAPKFNIVALRLPVATHPSKMNLLESGFVKGNAWEADQIYTIDTLTREPGHSCYCNDVQVVTPITEKDPETGLTVTNGASTNIVTKWFFVSGGEVPGDYFKPNDVLVIVSKNGGEEGDADGPETWPWTYAPTNFYTLPNRHMQKE